MSMDGTHMSLSKAGKKIIVLHEGNISPYIKSVPQPDVNFIEEDIGVYSIFLEEDNFVTPCHAPYLIIIIIIIIKKYNNYPKEVIINTYRSA
jgi:hypothetical protein